jgi:hypothetical protein
MISAEVHSPETYVSLEIVEKTMIDNSESSSTATFVPLMAEELRAVMMELLGKSTAESKSHVTMYVEHQHYVD